MAVHQPHLLDFSAPPNPTPMEAPPPAFDNADGLLALPHVDGAEETPWPQAAVSLSLFNYHQQPVTAAVVSVAPPTQLHVPAAPASMQTFFHLRSSRYLGPVQELLGEFCSLGGGDFHAMVEKQRAPAGKWVDDVEALSSGLWGNPSQSSTMLLLELERRKARLLSIVAEVDRRYRRYREQMRAVELSFEAVAGAGAAQVYTRLARQAMSRHFRCLRDAVAAQVRALRKAMGDRDASAPAGATKGDTPRLRVLDQCLRQQRAFQQPAAVENYPWRPQRGLPERAVAVLRAWLFEHFLHPYPNDVDKHILARQTGLSRSQVSNWFINARVRLWKPMIEDMYTEEVNQQNPSDTAAIVKAESSTTTILGEGEISHQNQQLCSVGNPNNYMISSGGDHMFRDYPTVAQTHGKNHSAASLNLGLQQQEQQQQQPFVGSSMMQPQRQRSARLTLEGLQGQGPLTETMLPYRNLMGSQSLHDLAG